MREFRLPTKADRKNISVEDLKRCLDLYENWYFREEEGMTFSQADRYWAKRDELAEYIKRREEDHGQA